ncbi:hypothetical protein WA158_006544 [Blastocystis sp. Blastoise]
MEQPLVKDTSNKKTYQWFCFKNLSAETVNKMNVIHLGLGFMLLFMAFNPAQNYSVKLMGDVGATCLGIVNISFSILNIIAPSVIMKFGQSRYAIAASSVEYGLFIAHFSYLIIPVALCFSGFHGFCACIVWAAQGVYLSECSTTKNRGTNSGLFWSIYMLIFGNLVATLLLTIFPVDNKPGQAGWNGNTSILFLVLGFFGILGSVVLFLLRKPIKIEDEEEKGDQEGSNSVVEQEIQSILAKEEPTTVSTEPQESIKDKLFAYGHMMVDTKVWLLVPLMLGSGYMMMWPAAMFNRQVTDATVVGVAMTIYGIIEVVFSLILGKVSDLFGNTVVLASGTIIGVAGLVVGVFANEQQNWLIHVAAALYAISDCAFQTQLMTLSGQLFSDKIDTAFAVLRMFQIYGASACFFLAPVFVDSAAGSASATSDMYLLESYICCGLLVLGFIVYCVLAYVYGTGWEKNLPISERKERRLSRASSLHESLYAH